MFWVSVVAVAGSVKICGICKGDYLLFFARRVMPRIVRFRYRIAATVVENCKTNHALHICCGGGARCRGLGEMQKRFV